jgi:hypothetical protein
MLMGYILVSVVINVAENCNVCLDDLKLIKLCKICSILWDTSMDDFVNEKKNRNAGVHGERGRASL